MAAGPLARLLAQVAVMGFGIVTRAFVSAYQQAAAKGASGAGKQVGNAAKANLRNKMTEQEALQILDLSKRPENFEEVLERSRKLYQANDPKKGGSFYLQSKAYRAKETLEMAMGLEATGDAPLKSKESQKSDEKS